ncbi:hypothetical protein CYMTET_30597 [Cymbomonas tetramitiformis]|uniref:Uncharacterized protein n=1 Tax=Cymbomonas tetramitiformis TaxID=36881 RepID=A0AAE0FIQ9_9CHLO|nr:hypothetical protein CYMTET_30597 [Cymbomonas tetramitiformis]
MGAMATCRGFCVSRKVPADVALHSLTPRRSGRLASEASGVSFRSCHFSGHSRVRLQGVGRSKRTHRNRGRPAFCSSSADGGEQDDDEDEDDIPQEIIDAETKSTPYRRLRLLVYGLGGIGGGALAIGRMVTLSLPAGVEAPSPMFEFNIPAIILDISASLLAAYLFQEEITNREANLKRIWQEVKKRRAEAGPPGGAGKPVAKGFGGRAALTKNNSASDKKANESKKEGKEGSFLGEVREGILREVDQANAAAKVQAYQLNDSLESRGVLPKLREGDADDDVMTDTVEKGTPKSTGDASGKQVKGQSKKRAKKQKQRKRK